MSDRPPTERRIRVTDARDDEAREIAREGMELSKLNSQKLDNIKESLTRLEQSISGFGGRLENYSTYAANARDKLRSDFDGEIEGVRAEVKDTRGAFATSVEELRKEFYARWWWLISMVLTALMMAIGALLARFLPTHG